MAAKTLYEYLDECDFSDTKEGQMYALVAELAWNAATKAAEEKFTSHNPGSPKLVCPECGGEAYHVLYCHNDKCKLYQLG